MPTSAEAPSFSKTRAGQGLFSHMGSAITKLAYDFYGHGEYPENAAEPKRLKARPRKTTAMTVERKTKTENAPLPDEMSWASENVEAPGLYAGAKRPEPIEIEI